ncbi:MAG TPA: metallophosphoesterase [Syntrophobacteria bacterium]|nr:metallophosphoesterase [Syntrophobacteria bacterium]
MKIDRRDFLKLAGIGGVVFASGLGGWGSAARAKPPGEEDFFFVQLSDTHWGFTGPAINPDAAGTLKKAVVAVNRLKHQPDFVMFTGDLTHVTDDDNERRKRMAAVRDIISELKVKNVKFMPGEHDAGLDEAAAFKEFFGVTHYTFDHKGVKFIVLDNVSDPTSSIGATQLEWLSAQLKQLPKDARIVVFTHRPLFDLYPEWDWYTRDGAKALELLMPYQNVTVFYGHIHQENHHTTKQIAHHAAKGLMLPLPAPGSAPKNAPIPWDPAAPYKGMGFREVEAKVKPVQYALTELPVMGE